MISKNYKFLALVVSSLIFGIFTDILLRQSIFGLNFLIWSNLWILVVLISGFYKKRVNLVLLLHCFIASTSALLVYLRSEMVVQIWLVLITFVMLANAFGRVQIAEYSSLTYFSRFLEWSSNWIISLIEVLRNFKTSRKNHKSFNVNIWALVSIPLVLVFIGLFASSDMIFRDSFKWLGDLLGNIGEFVEVLNPGRLITISFWSLIALIWLSVAIFTRNNPLNINAQLPKIISSRESKYLLLPIVIIFAAYSYIQLRYLFGNTALPDGMTYAMYARRGYGELLLATILASSLVYITHRISKMDTFNNRLLPNLLVILNMFVVFTAWRRLSLYESAYGWTMTRFVARMGLICLFIGCILLLLWLNKTINVKVLIALNGYVLLCVLLVAAIMNPVGMVTKQNLVNVSNREVPLDIIHLLSSSPDSYSAICEYAVKISIDYPKEYRYIKNRELPPQDGYYYTELDYDNNENTGLARHYVYTSNFKNKFHNCLP